MISIPETTLPEPFPPQQIRRIFAAGEVLFLVDPERLDQLGGASLLPQLSARTGQRALAGGAVIPAIGLEPGHYTVLVRSTATEAAMMPLSHLVFSTGFVLGTATGALEVWSGDRLSPEPSRAESPERRIAVTPGWYGVTVAAGIRQDDDGNDTQEWVCCFLLDPQPAPPSFTADLTATLSFFG